MDPLTEQVCARARELGADLVGIAPVSRFKNAPLRMSPQGLLPGAKFVIVAGIHHPDAIIELDGEPTAHQMAPYGLQSSAMNAMLDDLSFQMARFLEDKGYVTLPIAASNIWRYKGYKDLKVDFAPDLAHRYAAVAAGLGQIGWNGLCLTPEFGPRNRFVSIITEAELTPTPMYSGEDLCDKCMQCVKTCPTDAFRKEVREITEIEIDGKVFRFPLTNKWRCAWAENFQLNLAHEIPEVVNEDVIRQYMEKYGPHHGELGYCLRFCMVPQKRYYDLQYTRAPRRKKEISSTPPEELLAQIQGICARYLIDVVAVGPKESFAEDRFVHPAYHLPDVETVISIGMRIPTGIGDNSEMTRIMSRWLTYAGFEIAHLLDMAGYSATTRTKIADNLVAERLRIYNGEHEYLTVLTSAKLPAHQARRPVAQTNPTPEEVRARCREAGADLVGFFNQERYDAFVESLAGTDYMPVSRITLEDRGGLYGPYVPKAEEKRLQIKRLDQWLPGAKSVIVLGLHFPDSALDIAKVTPAETVGPFAFVEYEALRLLGDQAYRIIRWLNDAGYRANITYDLAGLASTVMSCRGMLPDMRANLFAALLSGLAYQGEHGYPITDEYGVRQRWLAIVTDMPLPNDPLYQGQVACEGCSAPCLAACPTRAIHAERIDLPFEGTSVTLYKSDGFQCDWAKTYALSGEEGPSYHGVEVDFPVPQAKTAESLISAVSRANFGVQKRLMNVCEECLRVCVARGK